MTTSFTQFFRFGIPDFLSEPWHADWIALVNAIDKALYETFIGGIGTIWRNNALYAVGDIVLSPQDGSIWVCSVSHTSAVSPTTFSADRIAHPTFWTALSVQPAQALPLVDGIAAVGSSILYAREDHVHPQPTATLLGARLAKTTSYSVANADNGKTIALSGGATLTLTFNAASGYDAGFSVLVTNEDEVISSDQLKWINLDSKAGLFLAAGESAIIYESNDLWMVAAQPRPPVVTGTSAMSSWVTQATPTPGEQWVAVAYSPEQRRAVMVSLSGTSTSSIAVSDDGGRTWTLKTAPNSNKWHGITWSKRLGLWIAVGTTGTGNRVMTSPDGNTWTARTTPADNQWLTVVDSPQFGLLIAVANSGTGNRSMTSPDGITWTIRATPADNNWDGLIDVPELGVVVSAAYSGTNRVMTSTNGTTWTLRATPAGGDWEGIAYHHRTGLLVSVGVTSTNLGAMTSPDGITWTARTTPNNGWTRIVEVLEKELLVALSDGPGATTGNRVMTSIDAVNWTPWTTPADVNWSSLAYAREFGTLIATSYTDPGGGHQVMTNAISLKPAIANLQPAGFMATKNAVDQTGVVTATFTKITFPFENYDTGLYYDAANSKWTPPPGLVQISACVSFSANVVAGAEFICSIYKNGVRFKDVDLPGAGAFISVPVVITDLASGTDYYEVYGYGAGAGNKTVSGIASLTYFSGHVVH